MRCRNCGREVPEGLFCTVCGAAETPAGQPDADRTRLHHFAAHPGEHVFQPSMFTTLFPHLGRHKVHEFRWAFILGLALIFVLFLFGLITAALLVSIFLLPLLYLLYLVEAEVYRDEPITVIGLTLGGGLVVGVILTLLTDWLISVTAGGQQLLAESLVGGLTVSAVLIPSIVVPIIQEVIKPLPALILRTRPKFNQTVDGLVFGVAAGLGFSIGETLVRYWNPLSHLPVQVAPAAWLASLITIGVLSALMQGATTGAITAAVWRLGRGRAGGRELLGIVVALAGHIGFDLGTYWLYQAGWNGLIILVWQAVIDGALLIYVRYLLHHALLDEASGLGYRPTVCPNCHRHITAAGFCSHCGKALAAGPADVPAPVAPAPPTTGMTTTEAN